MPVSTVSRARMVSDRFLLSAAWSSIRALTSGVGKIIPAETLPASNNSLKWRSFQRREGIERPLAAAGQIDDRLRPPGFPRFVEIAVGHPLQLRAPAADIGAAGIELLALKDRIEDAEIGRGVGAAAGHPL